MSLPQSPIDLRLTIHNHFEPSYTDDECPAKPLTSCTCAPSVDQRTFAPSASGGVGRMNGDRKGPSAETDASPASVESNAQISALSRCGRDDELLVHTDFRRFSRIDEKGGSFYHFQPEIFLSRRSNKGDAASGEELDALDFAKAFGRRHFKQINSTDDPSDASEILQRLREEGNSTRPETRRLISQWQTDNLTHLASELRRCGFKGRISAMPEVIYDEMMSRRRDGGPNFGEPTSTKVVSLDAPCYPIG